MLLPQNDPTEEAEQTRLQSMENQALDAGREMPVSPRDNHQIHIPILKNGLAPLAAAAAKLDQDSAQKALLYIKHWEDHLQMLIDGGFDKTALAPEVAELKAVGKQMGQIMAQIQHAAEMKQRGASPAGAGASAMGLSPDNPPGEPAPPAPGPLPPLPAQPAATQ